MTKRTVTEMVGESTYFGGYRIEQVNDGDLPWRVTKPNGDHAAWVRTFNDAKESARCMSGRVNLFRETKCAVTPTETTVRRPVSQTLTVPQARALLAICDGRTVSNAALLDRAIAKLEDISWSAKLR